MDKVLLASRQVERGWIHPFTYTPWACHAAAIGRLRSRDWLYPPMPPCSRRLCRIRQACAHRLPRYLPSLSLSLSIYPFLFLSAPCPRIHPFTQLLLLFIPTPRCSTLALSGHTTLPLSLSLSWLPSPGYFGATWVGCLTRRARNTSSKVGQVNGGLKVACGRIYLVRSQCNSIDYIIRSAELLLLLANGSIYFPAEKMLHSLFIYIQRFVQNGGLDCACTIDSRTRRVRMQ